MPDGRLHPERDPVEAAGPQRLEVDAVIDRLGVRLGGDLGALGEPELVAQRGRAIAHQVARRAAAVGVPPPMKTVDTGQVRRRRGPGGPDRDLARSPCRRSVAWRRARAELARTV